MRVINLLLASTAGLGWATCAVSQTAAAPGDANVPGAASSDIVVTGQRAADRNAIYAKRSAAQIIDVVSADDIGKIADASIGDALKRIAGVNTYNYQGEPRFATIRGFNSHYITSTLDGLQIASPDNQNQNNGGGRQFYLESLPSNIASRIEVYKTSTPDLEGHSIGGQINYALPSAFDFRQNQARISGSIGAQIIDVRYGGIRPTGQAEIFLTRRFGADDQFGIMLSGSYWRREQWIPQVEQGSQDYWYNANGTNSGQPYVGTGPVASERRWYDYDNNRQRGSGLIKFDWRPDDQLSAALTGFYFTQHETAIRNDTLASIGTGALVSNQTATTGTLSPRATAPGDITQNVRRFQLDFDRKTYGGQGSLTYKFNDTLVLDARAAYSHARFYNPQVSDSFLQSGLAFNYVQESDGVLFTPVNPTNYNDLTRYVGGPAGGNPQHYIEHYRTDADHYESKLKLASNMAGNGTGFGWEIGGSAQRTDHSESYDQTSQVGMPYTLADVISNQRLCGLKCNNSGIFYIDINRLQPLVDRYISTVPAIVNTTSPFSRAFSIRESIFAGFATLRWRTDNWSVVGGVRYEATDFTTTGFQQVSRRQGTATVTTFDPATASKSYGHWMPSAIISYDLASDMRVRAAYSRTIGRPKYTDMSLIGGNLNITNLSAPTLSVGNPELKPRTSDNFDVIYEWYMDGGQGLFSLGLFHKAVKNEIYLLGRPDNIDVGGGVLVPGTITSPVNSTELTTVDGIEFNLVKYFKFLPGFFSHFGINANGIVSKAHFPIRLVDGTSKILPSLPNQARFVSNLALFYEDDSFHARIAWNHTGSFVEERFFGTGTSSNANFYRIRWTRPSEVIDLSASYDINKALTVRANVTNLTGQGTDTNIGIDQEIPLARNRIPTAVTLGFSARF